MKVLIICHEFPPIGGGAGNAALHLAKHLKKMRHNVTVLTSSFKKSYYHDLAVAYIPVLRRHIDRTSPLELASFAISGMIYGLFNIRKGAYDICLAIHGIPSGWVALFLYKLFKIPYIVSFQGGDVPGFLPQKYNGLHQKIKVLTDLYWENAGSLIANSSGLKKLADVTARRINKKVEVIPNGVDSNLFKPDYSLRDNQTIRIIYTGRITSQKGLGCLIEAIKQITGKMKNSFNLEIIGEGLLKKQLISLSCDLYNEGIITFTDWLDKKKLLARYKQAHIFVLPSLYEGMSNSLLEAMACGCMVIATNIAGNNELVRDGENGFLFKPGDSLKLIEILTETLNASRLKIENMGKKSRTIAEKYNWDNVAKAYIYAFERIIENN